MDLWGFESHVLSAVYSGKELIKASYYTHTYGPRTTIHKFTSRAGRFVNDPDQFDLMYF